MAAGIDEKRWPARQLAAHHRRLEEPGAVARTTSPPPDVAAFDHKGVDLYAAYQARLRDLNAVDFGDLLLH